MVQSMISVKYGTEIVTHQTPFLWVDLQSEYKNAKSLEEFKLKIKTWKCDFGSCRLYQIIYKTICNSC